MASFILRPATMKLKLKRRNKLGKDVQQQASCSRDSEPMDKLPLELCELVLQHMPEMFAWRCRLVCRAWRHYIEDILSRDWLLGSRLLMMYINHPRMLVLDTSENRDMRLTRGDLVLDLVARQDDYLVFRFTASSMATLSQLSEKYIQSIRDFWPASMAPSRPKLSPFRFDRHNMRELKLYIWTLSTLPPKDNVPDMRLLTLRSMPPNQFLGKRRVQDFRLQSPDLLLVNRHILFSKLFGGGDDQSVGPGLPFFKQSL